MIDLSPLKKSLNGKPIALLGMGKSALAVFAAAQKAGIDTYIWDDGEAQRTAAAGAGMTVKQPSLQDLKDSALLCMAPGVPLTHPKPHPLVLLAQEAGIEIVGDLELFHRARPDARVIGITGTNGKSTTTALTGHILKQAGYEVAIGGNIGDAVMTLPDLPQGSWYVLELSSYQLDLMTTFQPDISILINVSPDHLDRHGDMTGYVRAKERIFRWDTNGGDRKGVAIIGMDDAPSSGVYDHQKAAGKRKMIPVSVQRPMMTGIFVSKEGMIFDSKEGIINLGACPSLRGQHNWQNAAIAYAAAREAGIDRRTIEKALQSFPGLAHRQNIIAAMNGITYINDSKATNDDAAAVALKTFSPIYWIAGGKSKGSGYKECEKYLSHVRHAFLIGEAEEEMAAWLDRKKVPYTRCGNLSTATVAAHRMAQTEKQDKAVVLLSPACASFDQFKSFEHRGDTFVDLVKNLKKGTPKKGMKA